jgi:hypothetical protein
LWEKFGGNRFLNNEKNENKRKIRKIATTKKTKINEKNENKRKIRKIATTKKTKINEKNENPKAL